MTGHPAQVMDVLRAVLLEHMDEGLPEYRVQSAVYIGKHSGRLISEGDIRAGADMPGGLLITMRSGAEYRLTLDHAIEDEQAATRTLYVGDGDLRTLGLVAMLAARYEMRRKGGRVPLAGFAHSDEEAQALLMEGVTAALSVPLDDVPQLSIAVTAERDALYQLREMVE